MVTAPSSSRRSSWDRRSSRPSAIFAASASVGLVSPRSTCESIGALTPLRSARSLSERSIASRRLLTRAPSVPSAVTAVRSGVLAVAVAIGGVRYHIHLYVTAAGSLRPLSDDVLRPLVVPQPEISRVAQTAVAGPLAERELPDQPRLDPMGSLRDRADVGERRVGALQLAHLLAQVGE